jgi:enamine deaminase RidA (YjgF/YER057c/UK114 family)
MLKSLIAAAAIASLGMSAHAAELKRQGAPQSLISRATVVPAGATTVYISGITPQAANAGAPQGTPLVYGDTKAQTLTIFKQMSDILKAEGMTMGDMTMLRVFLVGDPKLEGKMDFAGMNAAYSEYFGNASQPNKPARITMQISQLVNPAFLVEIEGVAAKAP